MRQREAISEARKRGTIAGRNAASWVFDGNTSDQTRQKVAQMIADGDPELYDVVRCPEWLSGEWAGESVSELLGDILPENEDWTAGQAKIGERVGIYNVSKIDPKCLTIGCHVISTAEITRFASSQGWTAADTRTAA